jgi:hypothetical protein
VPLFFVLALHQSGTRWHFEGTPARLVAMVRRYLALVLFGALGGCSANAGSSSGEPETADSVAVETIHSSSELTASSHPSASTGETPSADGAASTPDSSTGPLVESNPSNAAADSGASDVVSCDPRKLLCKRAAPTCDYGFVPRIVDGCYGECVRVDDCVCNGPDACPEHERYTCNNSRQRCTPYLN